ncbi:hypothetical protein ACI3L1_05270 [Deinococcus sp. SM5_A1]|uniref:hypothetical protein n=1 Tax=Deinococcus sp. SM5_A1 TaxID=3379094 RepID=UPI00385B9E0D
MASEILKHLHPALRIAWDEMGEYREPASEEDIAALLAVFPETPPDYLDIARQFEVLSLNTVSDFHSSFCLTLLSLADILGWLEWYPHLQESVPGAFFFAANGDISFFVAEQDKRNGVFIIETSVPDWNCAEYLAPSICGLLCDGAGWSGDIK